MKFDFIKNKEKQYSVVLFIQEQDFHKNKMEIEKLGKQNNVKLVVQPCPYEGIEFLYRVPIDIQGQKTSVDKEIFWQAIELEKNILPEKLSKISHHHYEFLLAILNQDPKKVMKERKELELLTSP